MRPWHEKSDLPYIIGGEGDVVQSERLIEWFKRFDLAKERREVILLLWGSILGLGIIAYTLVSALGLQALLPKQIILFGVGFAAFVAVIQIFALLLKLREARVYERVLREKEELDERLGNLTSQNER